MQIRIGVHEAWSGFVVGVTRVAARALVRVVAAVSDSWRSSTLAPASADRSPLLVKPESELRPHPLRRRAPLARGIALAVVALVAVAVRAPSELCLWRAVGRVAWCALFGRPGRLYGAKAAWRSVWLGQIDGPYSW